MSESVTPLHRSNTGEGDRVGDHLVQLGRMTKLDAERVNVEQKVLNMLFGRAAIALGLIDETDLARALHQQFRSLTFREGKAPSSPELVLLTQPSHPVAEAIRSLRMQLSLRCQKVREAQIISIVSPSRAEGRSFIAANLALALAQANVRTLLVDLDLRNPRQHRLFNLPNHDGVCDLALDPTQIGQVKSVDRHGKLAILPAGTEYAHPQEILASPASRALLQALKGRYEMIITDTPAWQEGPDALTITAHADAAVLVLRRDKTLQSAARKLVRDTEGLRANILGVVANSF